MKARYKKTFCSIKCVFKKKRGIFHPRWVGIGKPFFSKKSNRFLITVNGKKVYRARHLMENHIHRKLRKYEVVHHVNGNSKDDRIENLVIMTRTQHIKHHNPKTHWINTKCLNCNKNIFRYKSKKIKYGHFCSRTCNVLYIKPRKPNGINIPCKKCGKITYKRPCEINHGKNHFCSKSCGIAFNKHRFNTGGKAIHTHCGFCKKAMRIPFWRTKRNKNYYCSRPCMASAYRKPH